MAVRFVVEPLAEPIWFDTGLKMADGVTPRTVAARDTKELREYSEKKTYLGTYNKTTGLEDFILWRIVDDSPEPKAAEKPVNNGITSTQGIRRRGANK